MKKYFLLLILALFVLGCKAKVDLVAEKDNVDKVITKLEQIYSTEIMDEFSEIMAHDEDMVTFGTDVSERIVGWTALKQIMQQQFDLVDESNVAVSDRMVKVHESGQVAWFSEIMDWNVVTGADTLEMNGMRATGVLVKKDGKWIITQVHYSVPNKPSTNE